MNQATHQSTRKTHSTLWLLWVPLALAAVCCAALVDWPAVQEQKPDAGKETVVSVSAEPQPEVKTPPARPFGGRGLEARLMRSAPPELPVALSEEGQRMVTAMLNFYRCGHTGSKRSLPPVTSNDQNPEALMQSLASMPDACYVNASLSRIANPETSATEMATLFEDLLKRPDALKLRMLFIIASIQTHPMAAEALAQLRGLIGTDWEQDWARWEQAVTQLAVREQRGIRVASCRSR
jgi:hypothetical protein